MGMGCDLTAPPAVEEEFLIPTLHGYVSDEHLQRLLENRMTDASVPITVYYAGSTYRGSIESQGAGSRFQPKWSYQLKFQNSVNGLRTFNLSAQVFDKSMIRTAVASFVFIEMGLPVFRSNHVFFKLNSNDRGLYLMTERIDRDFFDARNMSVHELIKVVFNAKFSFRTSNNLTEGFEKKIPDDGNLNNLLNVFRLLDASSPASLVEEISPLLQLEKYLLYHAITSAVANNDAFTNNFYFYKSSSTSPYEAIPWDFDNSFSPLAEVGLYGHNDLIEKLLQNDSLAGAYKSTMMRVLEKVFRQDRLFPIIDSVHARIALPYARDPYLGKLGFLLQSEVDKLKSFIRFRRALLVTILSTPNGQ